MNFRRVIHIIVGITEMCCIDLVICCFPKLFPESWRQWQFQIWEAEERTSQRYCDTGPFQARSTISSFLSPTPRSGTPEVVAIPMTAMTHPSSARPVLRQSERDKVFCREMPPLRGERTYHRFGINYVV